MDWADEVAEKLCLDESGDHPRLPGMDEIATALRKAKADGVEWMKARAIEGIEMRADKDNLTELAAFIRSIEEV